MNWNPCLGVESTKKIPDTRQIHPICFNGILNDRVIMMGDCYYC